jgi:cytochrome b involved in lipid metabolism
MHLTLIKNYPQIGEMDNHDDSSATRRSNRVSSFCHANFRHGILAISLLCALLVLTAGRSTGALAMVNKTKAGSLLTTRRLKKEKETEKETPEQEQPKQDPDAPCYEQFYTIEEVESRTYNDGDEECWFVLYDTVYNMTEYIEEDLHPGGAEYIIRECGYGNVTEFFEEEKKHDRDLLEKEGADVYAIGKVGEVGGIREVTCEGDE